MAETPQQIVDRVLREHKRYTGDGLPNEPVNAPLPVGDPQSGPHNPKKKDLRLGLKETLHGAAEETARASDEADRAEAAAAIAQQGDGKGLAEFETRADAEAWPGVDPMPDSIVIRGDASVDDGKGGTFVLGHPSSDIIVVAGESYGRAILPVSAYPQTLTPGQQAQAQANLGMAPSFLSNRYRKKVVGEFPQRFADYALVLSTYHYDWVYPQAFWIDEDADELWVVNLVSGGDNDWAWVSVFDFSTKAEKTTFSAGSGTSEGIVIVHDGATRSLYLKHSADTLGRYDVTSLPDNLSRISPANTYDISFRQGLSYRNGYFYSETVTRGTGSFKHGISIFDMDLNPVGHLQLNPFVEGTTGGYGGQGLLNNRQGFAVGDGFIAGGYGGIYQPGRGDELNRGTDIGVKVVSPDGTLLAHNMCDAQKYMDKLTSMGITATRVENEGCFVTRSNRIYSSTLLLDSTSAGQEGGMLIMEEFSNDARAIDFSDCASVALPVFDPNYYRPLRMGFDPNTSMRNPVTGEKFTGLPDIWEFMSYMGIGRVEFYSSSFPGLIDWDGLEVPSSRFIEMINENNLSCRVNIKAITNGRDREIRWTGDQQSEIAPIRYGSGSPEGVVTAPIGVLYINVNGGAGTTLYVKTNGTGSSGWTAK